MTKRPLTAPKSHKGKRVITDEMRRITERRSIAAMWKGHRCYPHSHRETEADELRIADAEFKRSMRAGRLYVAVLRGGAIGLG